MTAAIERCREIGFCVVKLSWRINEDYDWFVSVDGDK